MEMTWYTRELPVLIAAIEYLEEHDYERTLQAFHLAPVVGMDATEVGKALKAMDGTYVRISLTGQGLPGALVHEVYSAGRRAAGQWPTPELVAQKLVTGLETAAATEADPEKKSKLRQTADFLGSAGKDLLINITASVIAKQSGID